MMSDDVRCMVLSCDVGVACTVCARARLVARMMTMMGMLAG